MCKIAKVSKSGYYKWLKEQRKIPYDKIVETILIKEIFARRKGVYGIRTIKMILEQDYQVTMNRKKIARIMKEQNLITKTRKQNPYKRTKIECEKLYCENLVKQNFKNREPLEALGIDITYLKYNHKFGYLCTLIDMKTTEVLSYSLSKNMEMGFVMTTIANFLHNISKKKLNNLIIHSDRGAHFTSKEYKAKLLENNIKQSMSLPGNPRDNAVIESFFGHMKDEIDLKKVKTHEELVDLIDDYMYYYNNNRQQWSKQRMTPVEYRKFLVA